MYTHTQSFSTNLCRLALVFINTQSHGKSHYNGFFKEFCRGSIFV